MSENLPTYGARGLSVRQGLIGYRHQLDRARRFLARIERPTGSDVDFQDMAIAFFQNCWHVKDWLKHDPVVLEQRPGAISPAIREAKRSKALTTCQQLCDGTKHLVAKPAQLSHVDTKMQGGLQTTMDCIVDVGGKEISGLQLARECIAEWERILEAHGLAIVRP